MHSYTHEFVQRKRKGPEGETIHFLDYVGSRCATETCPDSRNRAVLPTVKADNAATGLLFGTVKAANAATGLLFGRSSSVVVTK